MPPELADTLSLTVPYVGHAEPDVARLADTFACQLGLVATVVVAPPMVTIGFARRHVSGIRP